MTFKIKLLLLVAVISLSCKKQKKNNDPLPEQPEAVIDAASTSVLSKIYIDISGMKNSNGNLNVALYNSSSTFNDPDNAFKRFVIKAVSGSTRLVLDSIPQGTYAFAVLHDENSNNTMDKNLLGIPKEGFAFSNNAIGSFGPPSFDEAKFDLPAKATLTQIISLKFY